MAFISKIKAGDFNTRFKVKKAEYNNNTFGEGIVSYQVEATVWANLNVSSLRNINEKFEGDKLQSYGEFYIVVRYDSSWAEDLDPNWILEEDETGLKYEILSYIIDPRKEFIEFRTKYDTQSIA